jgi:hypothetical protein
MSKKNPNIFISLVSLVVFAVSFFLFSNVLFAQGATNSFTYTPMESIPGQATTPSDFYDYISAVYKFGIGAVGIAALLMITIGGYMYITSAGNTSLMDSAKGVITDAIVGVLLAMGAYLLLYIINPELVQLRRMSTNSTSSTTAATTTSATTTIKDGMTCPTGKCSQIDSAVKNNSEGIAPVILKSLFIGGEGCNNAKSTSSACGYSQVLYKYRKSVCGLTGSEAETCQAVQADTQLDINCGAKLVKEQYGRCGGGKDIVKIAQCYGDQTQSYINKVSAYYATCK